MTQSLKTPPKCVYFAHDESKKPVGGVDVVRSKKLKKLWRIGIKGKGINNAAIKETYESQQKTF
jgi:hypothetical protein